MAARFPEELVCDMAETYHVLNWRALGLPLAATLAAGGVQPTTGKQVVPVQVARQVLSVMMTCGMYDGSGDFAIRVGVPAKSGVGGGIMAVVPGRMGVGLFGPALDEKGNSLAGIRALELLSARLDLSVF